MKPVDTSGPNSPAMSYLAQLVPAERKPRKGQIEALSNHPAASVSCWTPKLLFLSPLNGASLMQLEVALLSC